MNSLPVSCRHGAMRLPLVGRLVWVGFSCLGVCVVCGRPRTDLVAVIDAPSQTTWQQDLLASARRVSAGVVGGLATVILIADIDQIL